MNANTLRAVIALNAALVTIAANAAERVKANNADNLNTYSSWVGNSSTTFPYENDTAKWDATVAGANSTALGGDMKLLGITIANPGGTVTIGGTHALTVDFRGINLGGASANLTLTPAGLNLREYAAQSWNLASGRTLTVNPGTFTRLEGASLGIQSTGTIAVGAAVFNDTTGIIGPWARHGTGMATRYAAVSGGNVTAYNGLAATPSTVGTAGTGNYSVGATGTFSAGASFNTLLFHDAAGPVSGDYTANGILNAGSGTLTLPGNATIGASRELVLTSPDTTRGIGVAGTVSDNPGGASGVTVTGGGEVQLRADNTYSGKTVVSSGILYIDKPRALGTADGETVIYVNGSRTTGGSLEIGGDITLLEPLTFAGCYGDNDPWQQALRVRSGTVSLAGPITITAASVRITSATASVLNLDAPITRTSNGNSLKIGGGGNGGLVNVNQPINNNNGSIDLHSGPGTVRFNVAGHSMDRMNVQWDHILQLGISDALPASCTLTVGAGSSANNASAHGIFDMAGFNQTVNYFYGDGDASNPPATRAVTNTSERLSTFTAGYGGNYNGQFGGNLALVKNGNGTLTLCGPNFHTGGTTANGGTLVLSNAVNHGSLTVNGGLFQFPPALTVNGTLSGTGGTIDTGAAGSTLTVNQSGDSAFSGTVSGSGALVKNGDGALTLAGPYTATGDVTVNAGILCFGRPGSLPSGTITIAQGATAGLGVGGANSFGAADLDALWPDTFAGFTLDPGASIAIDTSAGDFTYGPTPSSTRGLIKTGANTLRLTGTSDHTGGTFIRQGVLSIPSTAALPGWDTAGDWRVSPGAALAVQNAVSDIDIATLIATGNFDAGGCIGFDTVATDRPYENPIGNTANGALGVYKIGTNTLTLTGNSTYDGDTIIAGGRITIRHNNALGSTNGITRVSQIGGTSAVSYTDSTGQLRLEGYTGSSLTIDENIRIDGSSQYNYGGAIRSDWCTNTINGWIMVDYNGRIATGNHALILNGPIFRSGVSSNPNLVMNPSGTSAIIISNRVDLGTGTLSCHSSGTVLLCATGHVLSSVTAQYGCTVRLGMDDALSANRQFLLGNHEGGNGSLDLNGFSQSISRVYEQGTTASRPNNLVTNSHPSAVSTLTVNSDPDMDDTFLGKIIGAINLVKAGAANSTLTLEGANNIDGSITVRGGTLTVGAAGTLGAGVSGVTVEGGTLRLQNSSVIPDSVTVQMPATTDSGAKVHLDEGVSETVAWLLYGDKIQRAGTYGSSASSAQYQDNTRFAGTGMLRVRRDNAGTLFIMR